MKAYKLGNKVKAILRTYSPCKIGNIEMKYPNQPYTILETTDAQILFKELNTSATSATSTQSLLNYNVDFVDYIQLNNVALTDKILNLIFEKDLEPIKPVSHSCNSDNSGYIYLPIESPIYDLFIYNDAGSLECEPYRVFEDNKIQVSKSNSNYLVFYTENASEGYYLNRLNNITLSIDLEVIGNKDDTTENFWIHLEKCSLSINKNLYFNNDINAIDLKFKKLKSDNDYITLK